MSNLISYFVLSFCLIGLVKSLDSDTGFDSVCGYINGDIDRALDCSSESCGFLSILGHSNKYVGCCDGVNCVIPTVCIESGSASNSYTVECIDDSLPACATYTWPELEAKGYFCAPSRTTVTVITEMTSGGETTPTTERSATAGPPDLSSDPFPSTTETAARPTVTSTASGHPQPTEGGGPNLGTEHDLSSRQRIGAGVGSGVSGGLLLVFFA
ncbi:hypothetical protein FVEN_g10633 [Fusarium venenatum]|uniref:Extracellular membrane protein CFEM domain-containing protein n=1 Tax=Fusarium venenatum TaxID=56646 RepID=A0A2L2U2W3_9HYPO|nr:uncharacterized protein FVRRES_10147 [Fusarium venenatum]KAG8351282.1 hypothetical protein FVEN_g10633 [Fusarium venenatum]KAH6966780.1 hypothetical protein EDB82DRAFT_530467 [Fusarium venenatum]CEI70070.1 unnamed protein product [Fusarium venenatum]